jgi:hypothetical protein
MVYVLDHNGNPLMPTSRHGKVRHLLKSGQAVVFKRTPFTIKLLKENTGYTQPVSLGVDAGSKMVGLSATTEKKELYASELQLRTDIVKKLSTRRENRRTKRSRLRYRAPRFNNRKKGKGWLAPSIINKIQAHLKAVERVCQLLPVSNIVVETASFDIQKIRNPEISGKDYQQGEQLTFGNVREYVLFRDGHVCQCCKGKSGDPVLEVHHIESRKTGGNAPNNLITLCKTCHEQYHKGKLELPETIHRGMSFKDAAFMGIMRWAFYEELKKRHSNVSMTYGYITKNTRIENKLPKTHCVDARCISGNPLAEPLGIYYLQKKIRCHNRQIHKTKILKGGRKKLNQASYVVKGFRLYDKVLFRNQECFIQGKRKTGFFKLTKLDGKVIHQSAKAADLTLLEIRNTWPTEIQVQKGA